MGAGQTIHECFRNVKLNFEEIFSQTGSQLHKALIFIGVANKIIFYHSPDIFAIGITVLSGQELTEGLHSQEPDSAEQPLLVHLTREGKISPTEVTGAEVEVIQERSSSVTSHSALTEHQQLLLLR